MDLWLKSGALENLSSQYTARPSTSKDIEKDQTDASVSCGIHDMHESTAKKQTLLIENMTNLIFLLVLQLLIIHHLVYYATERFRIVLWCR